MRGRSLLAGRGRLGGRLIEFNIERVVQGAYLRCMRIRTGIITMGRRHRRPSRVLDSALSLKPWLEA